MGEEQTSGPVNPVVLLADELGDLAQTLLVVGLGADVDQVAGQAGEATLAVSGAAGTLRLCEVVVQLVYGVLEGLPVQLETFVF